MKVIVFSWFLLIGIFSFLFTQLFRLQIIEGKEQTQRAQSNRFRIEAIEPLRGAFYDRKGVPVVESNVDGRKYFFPEAFAHITGYIGEANQDELTLFGVEPGRWVGKSGLEREENGVLCGTDGGIVEEYSAAGKKIRTFSKTPAIAGRSVQLSLDARLQQYAYELLKKSGFKGAVIVSTLDGHVLTMVSYPSYNPSVFIPVEDEASQRGQQQELQRLFTDSANPMFNRAIGGLYPPASTFKIITSAAALENNTIDEKTEVEDTGELVVGLFRYGNWYYRQYGRTDGMVNVVKALQRSNDIFFYQIGGEVGIEKIAAMAYRFGLGKTTGLALGGEASGLVPNGAWKQEHLSEPWYLGDTYITSIGQGNLQATPLQVSVLTTAIANGGWLCKPQLVGAIVDKPIATLPVATSADQTSCQNIGLRPQTIETIAQGMKKACEPGGTGWPLFNFKVNNEALILDERNYIKDASGSAEMVRIPVACKTGTAEIGGPIQHGEVNQKTHAWFTAFAPIEKPEIIVTGILEEAGQGSDMGGPLVRDIMKLWFEGKKAN